MRYYQIEVTDQQGKPFRTWSSHNPDGSNNPGALNIELDAVVSTFADPMGDTGTALRIWGIPWADISKSADFNGMTISVTGGMSKGLPLANPKQAGLLVAGKIIQAYGNWIGTAMVLNLVIFPDTGTAASPANLVLPWRKGVALGTAIQAMLSTAFPGKQIQIGSLRGDLVLDHDQIGVFQTMTQFARWARQFSVGLIPDKNYRGVEVLFANNVFTVFDAPTATNPTAISFLDLIGQPTWLNPFQIQVITTMRADIGVSDFVTLPPGPQTILPQSVGLVKDRSAFDGTFQVNRVRHAGNFRQSDGAAWITALDLILVPPQ